MKVEIQIENNQIGETVLDLFKSLKPEEKKDLALQILREWLKEPSNFETPNYEQLLLDEFRSGKRSLRWGKIDKDTTDYTIQRDDNYTEALRVYKNSKQHMVDDIKNEIVSYYKDFITKEIQDKDSIENLKKEMDKIVSQQFPYIINNVLTNLFTNNMMMMQHDIKLMMTERLHKQNSQNG